MNLDLKNKRAVVCGSTQGIGKASALELALQGASITLMARNEDSLKRVVKELNLSKGQTHTYLVADFNYPDIVKERIIDFTKNNNVHILINNTGGPAGGSIIEAQVEQFSQAFSNHLICNHILTQAIVPGMRKEKYGRIINVISTSVKQPILGLGVSNTIRAAVANWAKTLSLELAQYNITVNNILPGMTDTQRIHSLLEAKSKSTGRTFDSLLEEMKNEIPMRRLADAKDIANAVTFLSSPAASYITGINLPVDGGRTGNL